MSPQLRSVEEAGYQGLIRKRNPMNFGPDDFFLPAMEVREKFGRLIGAKRDQVALIPSASYGAESAIRNIPCGPGNHAITVRDEYPSDYFTLHRWCQSHGAELRVIQAPETTQGKGREWNTRLLEAINGDTAFVVISSVHWMNGTAFDLEAIGLRCRETGAAFIVDGTQSVGALPIDVRKYHIDALVCAGYKWLMGPYSMGLAYYGERFNKGIPIEESWMNRTNAAQFSRLTEYESSYTPGAGRYNVGEFSNFILIPMMNAALDQVGKWEASAIQEYCGGLMQPLLNFLAENGLAVEEKAFRCNHLMGLPLPDHLNRDHLMQTLQDRKIYVSLRGSFIRVSPHLYNGPEDVQALTDALAASL
jgi:selenocysteine lyase/cysteine desulfurase